MKEDSDDIREIMIKFLAGEASEGEATSLRNWIAISKDNQREFEKTQKIFQAASRHFDKAVAPEIDVEKEWDVFLQKIQRDAPVRQLNTYRGTTFWLRIAAAVMLVVASSAVILYLTTKEDAVVFQAAAEKREVILPDGSKITLNRNSQIAYKKKFGQDHRAVDLTGEAFFDVQRNGKIPFVISAKGTTIEVLGTSFNVLAYDSLEAVEVVVRSGTVRLSVPKLKKEVQLTAGEKGSFETSSKTLKEEINGDVNYQSWNTHQLTFSETPLITVIEAINKTYHTNITLVGPVSDACVLTASFNNQTLDAVLNVLESTLNLTYTRVGNKIEITATGC